MFRNVKIVLVLIICLICQACDASGGASRPAAKAAPVMLWYATLMDGVFEVNEDHELYLYRLPDALTLELNFAPMMQAADGSLSAYAAGNASFKPQYQLCYGAAICEPKGEWLSAADEQTMVVQADWPELKTFFIMLRFRDASSGTPLMSLA